MKYSSPIRYPKKCIENCRMIDRLSIQDWSVFVYMWDMLMRWGINYNFQINWILVCEKGAGEGVSRPIGALGGSLKSPTTPHFSRDFRKRPYQAQDWGANSQLEFRASARGHYQLRTGYMQLNSLRLVTFKRMTLCLVRRGLCWPEAKAWSAGKEDRGITLQG